MPGTAPTGWQNPKTSYTAEDVLTPEQFERIEGNIYAIEQGERTIDPSQVPTGVVGHLRNFLDWFANRIRAILGTTNWHDAPPTTLTAAKSHIDAAAPHSGHATTTALTAHTSAAAPHSGHETPSGAQAKVDAHAAGTSVHGATSAATASRIMIRDASGRAKVAAPSAADDIARKDTVDAAVGALSYTTLGGWVQPGETVLLESLDEVQSERSGDLVSKCFQVLRPGRYRITGELRSSSDGKKAELKVLVPGNQSLVSAFTVEEVVAGSFSTTSVTYVPFTVDMSVGVPPGGLIEIALGSASSSERAYLRNVRVKYADGPPLTPGVVFSRSIG